MVFALQKLFEDLSQEADMPTAMKAQPRRRPGVFVREKRPSLFDSRDAGDPWIRRCSTESCLVLYLQAQPIAILAALPFDMVSLNHRLFELRRRTPRWMLVQI